MDRKNNNLRDMAEEVAAIALFLCCMCGAGLVSLFKNMGNGIKQKIQMVNGSNER